MSECKNVEDDDDDDCDGDACCWLTRFFMAARGTSSSFRYVFFLCFIYLFFIQFQFYIHILIICITHCAHLLFSARAHRDESVWIKKLDWNANLWNERKIKRKEREKNVHKLFNIFSVSLRYFFVSFSLGLMCWKWQRKNCYWITWPRRSTACGFASGDRVTFRRFFSVSFYKLSDSKWQ